ncbi:hypothetical protein WJ438_39850 [Streptomyces sp. GD-15H]|uniref:hypothetical protein n=1 Tax=Streptomyces sp. GD-15H TaxID=3129112 RepID=UPI00324839A9
MSELVRRAESVPADPDRHLSPAAVAALAASRPKSTSRAYRAGREAFTARCAGHGCDLSASCQQTTWAVYRLMTVESGTSVTPVSAAGRHIPSP